MTVLKYTEEMCTPLLNIMIEFVWHLARRKLIKIQCNCDFFFEFIRLFDDVPYFGTYVTQTVAYKTEILFILDAVKRITDKIDDEFYSMGNKNTAGANHLIKIRNISTKLFHMELHIFR